MCLLTGCPMGRIGLGLLVVAGSITAFGMMRGPDKKAEPAKAKAPHATPAEPAKATPETPKAAPDSKPDSKSDPKSDSKSDPKAMKEPSSLHDFTLNTLEGETQSLSAYKGKVALVVNVASKCGYTKQYAGLQKLYTDNKDKGFVILAFPSNDFGAQEPGSATEIKSFCEKNYGVTFPIFEKIVVSGATPHPLYKWLSAQKAGGPMTPQWNFSKYLVDADGHVVAGYASKVEPNDKALGAKIDELLKKASKDTKPETQPETKTSGAKPVPAEPAPKAPGKK